MIIKGNQIEIQNGRRPYPLDGLEVQVRHWVVRFTGPDNPFRPHKHEQPELWYVTAGQAIVSLDGVDQTVEAGDMVLIHPWIEHGLRTDSQVTWICLG